MPKRARASTRIAAERKLQRRGQAHGATRASAALSARGKVTAAAAGRSGLLVAEGDSWFDYPGADVLSLLEKSHGYRVESVAHHGDTIEAMAYDDAQLEKLVRVFQHVKQDGRVPRAILISGGGNDIAGPELAALLNHLDSGLPPLNEQVMAGIVDERLRFAVASVIGTVTALSQQLFGRLIPVLLHGYAHPVPDGRGYLGGFWKLPGPWLKPSLSEKGHVVLSDGCRIMAELIDRFNGMLLSIAGSAGFEHVTYVDVRPLLSARLPKDYLKSWDNELHPEDPGFARIAAELDRVIRQVATAPARPAANEIPKRGAGARRRKPAATPSRTSRAERARKTGGRR